MKQKLFIDLQFAAISTFFPLLLLLLLLPFFTSSAHAAGSVPATSAMLPFDKLAYSTLASKPRKVYAHYHTAFPISLDNKDGSIDYYAINYLNPLGENSRYKAQGGYLRQRPMPRWVNPLQSWKLDDMRHEIKLAKAVGIDGFSVNILNDEGIHWERTKLLLEAARLEGGGFRILLMPDMTAALRTQPKRVVRMMQELSRYPAALRLGDGRLVIAPYAAQRQSPLWWASQLGELRRRGINTAFMPVFHGWLAQYKRYASLSHGVSDWGSRRYSANTIAHWTGMAAKAHAAGLKWMAPVAPQDMRPKSSIYWEAGNSEMYRKHWEAAINGKADWIQLITWNDYSEHSEIRPSTGTGYGFYDLTAYYTTWFKTGRAPKIKRDAIYAFSRIHRTGARPNPLLQSKLMVPGTGSNPPVNRVEMLAFLTSPATLVVELSGNVYRKSATAGLTSFTVPLQSGTPVFRIVRNGNLVKTLRGDFIKRDIGIQNLLYHGRSSLRN